MKIKVDQEICIGAAACIAAAGKTFELNDTGKSQVKDPKGDPEEAIREAAAACPTQAIEIIEEN